MSELFRRVLIFAFIPLIVAADQWTKWLVLSEPAFNARGCLGNAAACGRVEVGPIFDLSMVWNYGMSFGAFQSTGVMRWVLVAVTGAIAIGFGVWLWGAARRLTAAALTLVVAGAIGNVIDRVRFGAVVDFIDVSGLLPWFPWVFNIADSAISVGAALLFLDQFLLSRGAQKPANT